MKLKIKKQENGIWVFLPKEDFSNFVDEEQIEIDGIFLSKDVFVLLNQNASLSFSELNKKITLNQSPQKEIIKKATQKTLNEEQIAVLQKLSKITFSARTYDYIQKIFSQKEKEVLDSLRKIGAVQLYKSQKYPSGVYNINQMFYQKQKTSFKEDSIEHLEKFGYAFFLDLNSAKRFIEVNNKRLQTLEAKTKKGFDKKIYCILPSFIEENKTRILELIEKEPKTIEYLEEKLKMPREGLYAILLFLAEDGLVFEKVKGSWQKA
ncbi:MAG: hypothetical protein ACK4J0_02830 [Candidatus Anstonellaceae archaeon]